MTTDKIIESYEDNQITFIEARKLLRQAIESMIVSGIMNTYPVKETPWPINQQA